MFVKVTRDDLPVNPPQGNNPENVKDVVKKMIVRRPVTAHFKTA